MNVMIVDDSPAMRAYVRRTLEMSGLDLGRVYQAGDGIEALAALERADTSVDLIFMDINMPNMNGEELLVEIRNREQWNATPILVISTDSTQKRMFRMRQLGAAGYVSKPCAPEMIRLKVEEVLGRENADTFV